MAFNATPFTDTQSWVTDKIIVESVLDSDAEVSLQAFSDALAAVLGGASGIPAIYKETDLLLKGGLDFGDSYAIWNLKRMIFGTTTKVAYLSGYGAVGDGVTSDRSAFINALTDLEVAGGGVLYVDEPSVSYLLDDTVTFDTSDFPAGVPENIRIIGLGTFPTILIKTGDSKAMFDVDGATGIVFENFQFSADATQTGGRFVDHLGDHCRVEHCRFNGVGGVDGAIDTVGDNDSDNIVLNDLFFTGDFGGSIVAIQRTRNARLQQLTFDITSGTPDAMLWINAAIPGAGNQGLVVDGLYIYRTVGDTTFGALHVVDDQGTSGNERARISNFEIYTGLDTAPAVLIYGDNVSLVNGDIYVTTDGANSDGILVDAAIDTHISDVRIEGADGRDGASTDCLGYGIRLANAPDGLQILNSRIRGFNHANGRAIGPSGVTPVELHQSGNSFVHNANDGASLQVDLGGGVTWNYGFNDNMGRAIDDANYEA